jgi:hypothetical protein
MVSVDPSTAAIVPRTRTVGGCCAETDEAPMAASTAAHPSVRKTCVLT